MEGIGRVAIIGGGPAGVCAIKCCVEEGLAPTCYEQHDDIGGAWYYTEQMRPNQGAGSYEKLVTNTSKEMSCFSDFPMPEHFPQFVTVHQYHQYLHRYADHFDLKKYVRFNHSVTKITPAPSFRADGRWRVFVRENDDSCVRVETYDHVMVCTGPYRRPKFPVVRGMDKFRGRIMHMHQYRTRDTFIGKKVLVIGNQTSALEAVVEAAQCTRPIWLSTKHKFYYLNRHLPNGLPGDVGMSRHAFCDRTTKALRDLRKAAEDTMPKSFRHLLPEQPPFLGGCFAVVDGFTELLERRQVQVKPKVDYLTESEVVFEDGSVLDNVDILLFATGYLPDFDIIDIQGITGVRDRIKFDLYLWMFPTFLEHMSLAIVDLTPLYQSQWTVMELQARLAARVFSGRHQLPDRNTMRKFVSVKRQHFMQKCGGKFQIVPIQFQEELAEELGVQPSFWRLFWKNPIMAYKCYYGPALPIIYRLVGPGWKREAWDGYDDAIRRMLSVPNNGKRTREKHYSRVVFLGLPVLTGLSVLGMFAWLKFR